MSDYFEPWVSHKGVLSSIKRREGEPVKAEDIRFFGCFDEVMYPQCYEELAAEHEDFDQTDLSYSLAERAADCVNALVGVEDPAEWKKQVLEDFKTALQWIEDGEEQDGQALIVGPMKAKYFNRE